MDRFRTMESFVRVVHAGSFSVAASQLGLSRALVSRHVGDLEARLGVRLLNRSTRSLNLTDEGRSYLSFCEQLFRQIEGTERAIVRTRSEPTGTLKMMAPKSFGSLHLADAVIAFARVQPRLRVSLILDDVSIRTYDFLEKGLDLALRISSMRNASVIERPVAPLEWILCASPDYLSREGRPASPADLARHDCLVHVHVSANDRIWRFQGPRGAVSVKVSGAFFSNSALALRKAALAGLGITFVPRYCVAGDLAAGELVPVLPRYRVPARPLMAVFPRMDVVPQKVALFVDFLTDWMAARNVNAMVGRMPESA
ncbi:MAG: LysR family transcriptional regulator [Pseudorhodoplanes sp.]|mgnify:CR=1 FL=1|nr:LysR family transcriptional regulator [Pseudorhodoplanes sp.]MCL4711561.1 LysR family transcriptional regulator [Pseudorhodoplanes sp.]MCQ3942084.1 LysR family transcriptional regulator [Alphaproteobacteria bacterium]GIK78918.1 MAG: LysR family transcriptional regulator [Alphaproteobacteria bacterium]